MGVRELLRRLRRALASGVDPDDVDGFDAALLARVAPAIDALSRLYFRMEVEGLEGVPDGPALLVGNHNAGITFMEPFGFGARWYRQRGGRDPLLWLVHDAMLALPGLRTLLVRAGCVRASHSNAEAALGRGHKVVVFPGGNLEAFRPYRERYRIKFAGHKGFARLALRAGVPVVPFVVVGGHESFYVLHDGQPLARRLGLKKLVRSETCAIFLGLPWGLGVGPIFHLPLPTKSQVRFLEPILPDPRGAAAADDPAAVDALYAQVTSRMQAAMDELGGKRRLPILG
ncbi:MAG TPA: 1-acyl-sn-glycerol-3-phosphate acyltransferase [Myxococcota bacterium]|nr:1-acyl-sn-glycerol-3-phosphate acyltransferase [Myxococcota bacterium]HRY91837.1 1-acyl-sn-glycerol-3-phosphate acyltransferase [Myxococcota bacterium]HSA21912.1 1-acyl-sn-glycerol-3-phosphate acyltransferase [Myxococcota bacterium]